VTRWRWYWTHEEGWDQFEREVEAVAPWAMGLIALAGLLIWLANGAPTP